MWQHLKSEHLLLMSWTEQRPFDWMSRHCCSLMTYTQMLGHVTTSSSTPSALPLMPSPQEQSPAISVSGVPLKSPMSLHKQHASAHTSSRPPHYTCERNMSAPQHRDHWKVTSLFNKYLRPQPTGKTVCKTVCNTQTTPDTELKTSRK